MTLGALSRAGLPSPTLDQPVLIGVGAVFARCIRKQGEVAAAVVDAIRSLATR